MYIPSCAGPEHISIASVAAIAASILPSCGMNSYDAVLKSYELLEIAAAGQNREMPLPEAYKNGIEQHRQLAIQIRQLEQAQDEMLPLESGLVLMGEFSPKQSISK